MEFKDHNEELNLKMEDNGGSISFELTPGIYPLRKYKNSFYIAKYIDEDLFNLFVKAYDDYLELYRDRNFYQQYPKHIPKKSWSYEEDVIYDGKYYIPARLYVGDWFSKGLSSVSLLSRDKQNDCTLRIMKFGDRYTGLSLCQTKRTVCDNRQAYIMRESSTIKEVYEIYKQLLEGLNKNEALVKRMGMKDGKIS